MRGVVWGGVAAAKSGKVGAGGVRECHSSLRRCGGPLEVDKVVWEVVLGVKCVEVPKLYPLGGTRRHGGEGLGGGILYVCGWSLELCHV